MFYEKLMEMRSFFDCRNVICPGKAVYKKWYVLGLLAPSPFLLWFSHLVNRRWHCPNLVVLIYVACQRLRLWCVPLKSPLPVAAWWSFALVRRLCRAPRSGCYWPYRIPMPDPSEVPSLLLADPEPSTGFDVLWNIPVPSYISCLFRLSRSSDLTIRVSPGRSIVVFKDWYPWRSKSLPLSLSITISRSLTTCSRKAISWPSRFCSLLLQSSPNLCVKCIR